MFERDTLDTGQSDASFVMTPDGSRLLNTA